MTRVPDDDRRRFAVAVADAAGAVVELLGAAQPRTGVPFPIAELLPPLTVRHRALQEAVDGYPGPLAVDATGRTDPLGQELAGLMSWLQLLRVLYRGLDDIPEPMRITAGRSFSAAHLAARRVRDRARRLAA
ncbi:hypothetical protein GCM10022225_84040 [Plantactinospora mayteni]|uniref:Uncharacterized protein n=1 Tax=Plantactinospora mayteni TaxID=566021 RepID=A0ABQ4F4L1_9ACTN|nr:hypothetical protein [Plantactinospora mayteni]GIH01861.1 hypothetical protein Pma05_84330 [Plantactinospora mayteni]